MNMDDKWTRTQDLSQEVHVRQDELSCDKDCALSVHAQVMCMLRVSLFML